MTEALYRLTPKALMYLDHNCSKHLDVYRNPDADFDELLTEAGYDDYKEAVEVKIDGSIVLELIEGKEPRYSELQALKFYQSLKGMSPRLATDPSIFAYINHFYLHRYGLLRWKISDDDKQAEKDIRNHWTTLGSNFSNIYERNIAGRVWWIAHTVQMAANASNGAFTAEEALGKFVSVAEYYHRTMEWEILYNYDIMAECIRSLLNESNGISIKEYRNMLSSLNREAGGRLLDALNRKDLQELVINKSKKVYTKS